jgi:hypothetical protein
MNIVLASLHDQAYQPLGDITWTQNKIPYADLHEYAYCCKTDNFYGGVSLGFEKILFIRDLLNTYTEIDWIWWTGCDAMITNFTIKVEERVDNQYHFIIATDCNGVNADSFFVRNSPEGKGFIDHIIGKMPLYKDHGWQEQQIIIDSLEEFKSIIKLVPQKLINAYDYKLYPECQPVDKLGENGQWMPGDFLIQWPGTGLAHRIHLAQYYSTVITK